MEAEKIGLDDFLARGGDAAQVLELASPTPPVPAQAPTSVADRLVKLVRKEIVELWHDQEGAGYATVVTESHGMQHLPCTDKPFVQWVRRVIHAAEGKSPSKDTISTVTATLESEAAFGSASHPTSHRIGHHGDSIWLNLANKGGEVVQIQAGSWKVSSLQECPIRFIAPGALPLPSPSRCGDLSTLRQFINAREDDQILIEAFMIGAFLKTGTLPILFVSGGQGSAKSTGSRLVRSVFDPSRAPLLPIPKDVKEMAYLLANNFVLAFDNASAVSHEISDALCRVASRQGLLLRELFTTTGQVIVSAYSPIIVNGIPDVAERQDLADRGLFVQFQRLGGQNILGEAELFGKFEEAHPVILGGLLDRVALAMQNHVSVRIADCPRLADFAKWVVASEPGAQSGAFMEAYRRTSRAKNVADLENDPVASAIVDYVRVSEFQGTITSLLELIRTMLDRDKLSWTYLRPLRSPGSLGKYLSRIEPLLVANGVRLDRSRGCDREILLRAVSPL